MSEEKELLRELVKPYEEILEDADYGVEQGYIYSYLECEAEVVVTIGIEGGWIYLTITENDYSERGEDREPEQVELLHESWELSKPNTIEAFHKVFKEFIRGLYGEIVDNLTERLHSYTESLERYKE
jgi:hypothetical protein